VVSSSKADTDLAYIESLLIFTELKKMVWCGHSIFNFQQVHTH